MKRLTQLTGHFLPDNIIHPSTNVGEIVDALHEKLHPSRPRKLAAELAANKSVQQIQNLKIFPKRQTLYTRDEELGRQVLIEDALRERNLLPERRSGKKKQKKAVE